MVGVDALLPRCRLACFGVERDALDPPERLAEPGVDGQLVLMHRTGDELHSGGVDANPVGGLEELEVGASAWALIVA